MPMIFSKRQRPEFQVSLVVPMDDEIRYTVEHPGLSIIQDIIWLRAELVDDRENSGTYLGHRDRNYIPSIVLFIFGRIGFVSLPIQSPELISFPRPGQQCSYQDGTLNWLVP